MSSSRNGLIGLGSAWAWRAPRRPPASSPTGCTGGARTPWRPGQPGREAEREVVVEATDGVALHVEVDEPRSGVALDEHGLPRPTVVMSHGYCLTSECWVFQRRYLRWAGHRVVVWDQRGHGRSGRGVSSSYTIAQLGQDLASVITAVAPDGPLVLVGHSMGGMTTMALGTMSPTWSATASSRSGRSRRRPGVCPSPPAGSRPRPAGSCWSVWVPGWRGSSSTGRSQGILSANSELAEFLVERYSFASPVPRSVVKLASKMLLGTNLTVMSSFTPAFDDYDQTGGLAAYDGCETLVFNGEQDVLTPPSTASGSSGRCPGPSTSSSATRAT